MKPTPAPSRPGTTRYRLAAVAIIAVGFVVSTVVGLFGWWVFLKVIVWMFGPIQ